MRNDWAHVVFDDGDYCVDTSGDGCVLRLAMTNKQGTTGYVQNIGERGPGLAELLREYRPIAYALRPPGQTEAPVLCYCADQGQAQIGRMLARRGGSRAGKAGFDDGPITDRRKGWPIFPAFAGRREIHQQCRS